MTASFMASGYPAEFRFASNKPASIAESVSCTLRFNPDRPVD
jgi:hypothetical protein